MKIYSGWIKINVICYYVLFLFGHLHNIKIKSLLLQLLNLLTVLICQQGSVFSRGKLQVQEHDYQQHRAHRAMNLCRVTASAQHWQNQPACDNSSWVDREAVTVTDTTGFSTHTEHLNTIIWTWTHTQTHMYWQDATLQYKPQHVKTDETHRSIQTHKTSVFSCSLIWTHIL